MLPLDTLVLLAVGSAGSAIFLAFLLILTEEVSEKGLPWIYAIIGLLATLSGIFQLSEFPMRNPDFDLAPGVLFVLVGLVVMGLPKHFQRKPNSFELKETEDGLKAKGITYEASEG